LASEQAAVEPRRPLSGRRLNTGDLILLVTAASAAVAVVALVALIVYKVVEGAKLSFQTFGISFVWTVAWDPVKEVFGAGSFLFGTVLTSLLALALATPLSIGIALYLTELAPRYLRGPITSLVETLAAIPSVVLGLWGIIVLGPFLSQHVEPWLHDTLGFIPLFGPPSTAGASVFTATIILTIMMLPIIASITRELFLGVPRDLKEGSLALGSTRWEMVRGVVFPYARGGIAAAMILGLGRGLGEAIAVTQVIGGGVFISWNLFSTGDTLASKIAASYQGATTNVEVASLFYLAVILLVFSLVANIAAQWIVRTVNRKQGGAAT